MTSESTIADEILANALRPQASAVDGQSVTERSLADQIAADKYLKSQQAVQSAPFGVRYAKIVPPGGA